MTTLTLSDEHPTARKEHRCDDCGRTIRPGEKYRRWSGIHYDGPYTWKSCAHCDRVATAIWATEESRYFTDEGIYLGEWLIEYQLEPLATQWRQRWAGVSPDALDLSVIADGLR